MLIKPTAFRLRAEANLDKLLLMHQHKGRRGMERSEGGLPAKIAFFRRRTMPAEMAAAEGAPGVSEEALLRARSRGEWRR